MCIIIIIEICLFILNNINEHKTLHCHDCNNLSNKQQQQKNGAKPGISILFAKPVKQPPDLFSFMSPLSLDVWIYMATAYMGVSVLLFVLAR